MKVMLMHSKYYWYQNDSFHHNLKTDMWMLRNALS
jgi:hypothetical protein